MVLPIALGGNLTHILEFHKKLITHLQSLEPMGKLNTNKGYVRNMLDKLPQI